MVYKGRDDAITKSAKHSIKKFELISEYVKAWIQILMQNKSCKGIVYIDCMSNSGVYRTENNEEIEGTALLVSNIIADAMKTYTEKQAYLYFNDFKEERIDLLTTRIPKQTENFHIQTEVMDANKLLRKIGAQLTSVFEGMHFLLVYDPYDAHIEWDAIEPFLKNWGEVIINHMVSDTIRAAKTAKKPETIQKYENTYKMPMDKLLSIGSDRKIFEEKIEEIILAGSGKEKGKYYIASFPFFNSKGAVIYNLIHCTGHYKGFELFKTTAWHTFGDKSSMKVTKKDDAQMTFNFDVKGEVVYEISVDESCYNLRDVALYVQKHFKGQVNVPNDKVWEFLGKHPVFPTRNYKNKIKNFLKSDFNMKSSVSSMTFSDRSY